MTIKLAELHGRVLDAMAYDFLAYSRYGEIFGEPGRRYFEVLEKQYAFWMTIMKSMPADMQEVTPENVWTMKGGGAPSASDLSRRPAVLDAMGVRRQLVTPAILVHVIPTSTGASAMQPPTPPEGIKAALDLLDAYNEWAADFTKKYSDRIRIPGAIATSNFTPGEIATRAGQLIKMGLKMVMIPSKKPPGAVSPADPALDPFYAQLAEANVPLLLRGGSQALGFRATETWGKVPDSVYGIEKSNQSANQFEPDPTNRAAKYPYMLKDAAFLTTTHQAEETFLTAMVIGGVFERHPKLRLGLLKLGAGWLGPLAERMDRGMPPFMKPTHLPKKPSEYLNRNVRIVPWADGGDGRGHHPFSDSPYGGDGDEVEPVDLFFQRYPQIQDCFCFATDYPLDEGGKWSLRKAYDRVAPLGDDIIEKHFIKNAQLLMP